MWKFIHLKFLLIWLYFTINISMGIVNRDGARGVAITLTPLLYLVSNFNLISNHCIIKLFRNLFFPLFGNVFDVFFFCNFVGIECFF